MTRAPVPLARFPAFAEEAQPFHCRRCFRDVSQPRYQQARYPVASCRDERVTAACMNMQQLRLRRTRHPTETSDMDHGGAGVPIGHICCNASALRSRRLS